MELSAWVQVGLLGVTLLIAMPTWFVYWKSGKQEVPVDVATGRIVTFTEHATQRWHPNQAEFVVCPVCRCWFQPWLTEAKQMRRADVCRGCEQEHIKRASEELKIKQAQEFAAEHPDEVLLLAGAGKATQEPKPWWNDDNVKRQP